MAADLILRSYGDSSNKEDVVLNAIELLTPRENWFLTNLGKTKAINTTHSYLVDTLRTPATQSVVEADDYVALANSTPTRLNNVVEHIAIPFKVSQIEQSVQKYHGENELERQTTKAMADWGNAAEFDLVRSTLVSGASGTKPKMNGIIAAISKSTNTTAHTSGTVFSASILNGLMLGNWENSNGDVATDLFMGSFLRNVLDGFTAKSNTVVAGLGLTELVNSVDAYRTSHGVLRIHNHRYVQQSTDATGRILAVRPEKLKLAYLRMPFVDTTLARSGPYDVRAIAGDLTVEVNNQDSNWFASGFDKD